nr:MAG TPA: hypothetical protein [Caudoviricetes sp.]
MGWRARCSRIKSPHRRCTPRCRWDRSSRGRPRHSRRRSPRSARSRGPWPSLRPRTSKSCRCPIVIAAVSKYCVPILLFHDFSFPAFGLSVFDLTLGSFTDCIIPRIAWYVKRPGEKTCTKTKLKFVQNAQNRRNKRQPEAAAVADRGIGHRRNRRKGELGSCASGRDSQSR